MFDYFKRLREKKEFEREQARKASEWAIVGTRFGKCVMQEFMWGIHLQDINIRLRTVLERNGLNEYRMHHYWDCPQYERTYFERDAAKIRDNESKVEAQFIEEFPDCSGCKITRSYEKASDLNFE